jgi:predicted small lipoprotein YifL
MHRVLVVGLAGLFLLAAAALTGCGNRGKATIPEKAREVPKQGPVPAGAPGGGNGQPKKALAAD